ncbi:MAG TPA: Crp/Fnr family transcriptional regulator [Egibacteraceae bacterium]|nr:Crp/Fnr family transcriptional regulator [Egibacteraceae bacterium]
MDKQDILERVAFYRDAPPRLRSSMLGAARYRKLAPGESLFTEGEPASHVAALGSGSIRVFRAGATGRQITLYHVRPQESSLVGMLSVLLGRPLIATAQAEVATEVAMLPAAALREWVSVSEAMRGFIFETMTRALVDITSLLEDVAFRSVESRLAVLLGQHADDEGLIRMRHEDLAAELGTAREVVSRILESFERHGVIGLARGRIVVRDAAALRALG